MPDYADPLSRTSNPKEWWRRHSPLFVQTVSVASPAGGDMQVWDPGFLRITVRGNVITEITRENHLRAMGYVPFMLVTGIPPMLMSFALEGAQNRNPRPGVDVVLASFALE